MADASKWYVVFTKPRREKTALENLDKQGFRCFFPQVIKRSRRKNTVEALFPRYLFIEVDTAKQSVAPVRATLGVVGLVRFGDQPASIPRHIIQQIRQRIDPESGLVVLQSPTFKPGDKVTIQHGPLQGLEGIFQARAGRDRAILLMSLLGGDTKVQVETDHLQPPR